MCWWRLWRSKDRCEKLVAVEFRLTKVRSSSEKQEYGPHCYWVLKFYAFKYVLVGNLKPVAQKYFVVILLKGIWKLWLKSHLWSQRSWKILAQLIICSRICCLWMLWRSKDLAQELVAAIVMLTEKWHFWEKRSLALLVFECRNSLAFKNVVFETRGLVVLCDRNLFGNCAWKMICDSDFSWELGSVMWSKSVLV